MGFPVYHNNYLGKRQDWAWPVFQGITEHCLFGVKGKLPYKVEDGKRQQGKTVLFEKKSKHSVKPDSMRLMIEKVSYPPYIELFARHKTDGWNVWGLDV
ncbi:MAG: hypothetical protein KAJ19_10315 [Gammaproteobacteria bacterium]|nr:hypothetical protein [Gammaproteobacteria bacterium]